MAKAHRQNDARAAPCGAKTIVIGQSTVFCNGKLWAVKDDINEHGNGQLINTTGSTVFCEGKPVIVKGDLAKVDNAGHVNDEDKAEEHSENVSAYG